MKNLSIGFRFKTNWKGCLQPKEYKVVDIDEENNVITVVSKRLHETVNRFNPPKTEVWPNLDRLHIYFEIGDYCAI